MVFGSTKYLQMSQGFESSEGILGESLDVIILNEPEKRVKKIRHLYVYNVVLVWGGACVVVRAGGVCLHTAVTSVTTQRISVHL